MLLCCYSVVLLLIYRCHVAVNMPLFCCCCFFVVNLSLLCCCCLSQLLITSCTPKVFKTSKVEQSNYEKLNIHIGRCFVFSLILFFYCSIIDFCFFRCSFFFILLIFSLFFIHFHPTTRQHTHTHSHTPTHTPHKTITTTHTENDIREAESTIVASKLELENALVLRRYKEGIHMYIHTHTHTHTRTHTHTHTHTHRVRCLGKGDRSASRKGTAFEVTIFHSYTPSFLYIFTTLH